MGFRSLLSKPYAAYIVKKQLKEADQAEKIQLQIFNQLISRGRKTKFGFDHNFEKIQNYQDFKQNVPIRSYEELTPYIHKVVDGHKDILWPGLPLYFAKTSGTTSGAKYIPITKDSISNHINGAKDALLHYIHGTGKSKFLDGKLIFLSGSPEVEKKNGILTGRLSGIVNHHVPNYLRTNQLPAYATNCIKDWETKLDKIIEETLPEPMTLISGIPPWVQMYFDKLQEKTGKQIAEIFPDFQLLVHGGVNFSPYREKMFESIGKPVDAIETYPASEGFIAFQDSQDNEGLLLILNSGIFYEFIPLEEFFDENPTRLHLGEVTTDINYALIINNNAGLWGYSIGDTVKFVSLNPPRIVVTGRVNHFISAFGEHVIGEEVENALARTMKNHAQVEVVEFTVAPKVNPEKGKSRHEWYIEFSKAPDDVETFAKELNKHLQKLNPYYDDLIEGNILRELKVLPLKPNTFREYMKSKGKLGGQNKVPRLANDRRVADDLGDYVLSV